MPLFGLPLWLEVIIGVFIIGLGFVVVIVISLNNSLTLPNERRTTQAGLLSGLSEKWGVRCPVCTHDDLKSVSVELFWVTESGGGGPHTHQVKEEETWYSQ